MSSVFCLLPNSVSAALVTVNSKGQIVWQVLGDSTIKVKSIAENITVANGKIELTTPNVTNSKEDLVEVEARADTNNLKISSVDNKFSIEENGITAQTHFPIIIDADKNTLSVTTKSGTRLISILPYEASTLLMRAKLINKVTNNAINLNENEGGQLQYQVSGIKNINLFNVATITANVNSTVSATSGEILKIDEPQWLKFFGFLFS